MMFDRSYVFYVEKGIYPSVQAEIPPSTMLSSGLCLLSSPWGFLTLASYLAILSSKALDEEHYKGVIMAAGARSIGVCLTVLAVLKENWHRGQLSPM